MVGGGGGGGGGGDGDSELDGTYFVVFCMLQMEKSTGQPRVCTLFQMVCRWVQDFF